MKLRTQSEWYAYAVETLPAAGFGNFDPGIIIDRGQGSRVWDMDGQEYIDLLIGSGPMLLGHGHPEVMEAVLEQLPKGMTFFANNAPGIELAHEICKAVPCAEQVRFVASGGEADMYAIRLARAFTGRTKILKFEGGYHGMSAEAQMSLAPTRLVNFPQAVPDSAGIPAGVQDEMLVADWNDIDMVRSILAEHGPDIAAVICEPLQRIIPALPGFLAELRALCSAQGVLLIFDEIVTGFRLAYGGAQERYGVLPDIVTLGKIIGGGFALAAVAASRDIMAHFDKDIVGGDKWLMQLGTLSGNPVAAVAGLKTMEVLRRPGQYVRLIEAGEQLMRLQSQSLTAQGIAHRVVGDATLFDVLFLDQEVRRYRDTLSADSMANQKYNSALRKFGVFKSPGKLYPSLALDQTDMNWAEGAFLKAAQVLS